MKIIYSSLPLINGVQLLLFIGIISSLFYYTRTTKNALVEFGSFDPQFKSATSLANVTYTGNYNKVGKMVFFCVNVQFPINTVLGTSLEPYQITLPFPARQTFTSRGGTLHNSLDAKYHIAGIVDTLVDPTNSIMKLYYSGSTTDLFWKYNTPVGWLPPGGNSHLT